MSQLSTIKLQITGMDCTACAVNIDLDLEEVSGIHNSKTNYASQITQVTFDSSVLNTDNIIDLIKTYGYETKVLFNKQS